ncbi:uncharacterized protein LOC143222768 isoform X3 [Tachypleus tridentatus]|uniref:uncharacterized protein LOC143222768 isoform X3 n=1 Tax=Tachypleus tridentatus TaxID=6853 RepID=UPI003FD58AB2
MHEEIELFCIRSWTFIQWKISLTEILRCCRTNIFYALNEKLLHQRKELNWKDKHTCCKKYTASRCTVVCFKELNDVTRNPIPILLMQFLPAFSRNKVDLNMMVWEANCARRLCHLPVCGGLVSHDGGIIHWHSSR